MTNDETKKQQGKKEKNVASARDQMDKSKERWKDEDIHFNLNENKSKYIGCVTKRIGVTHINEGKDCQDSCKVDDVEKNIIIVAIADGHGDPSHDLSKHGSRIACDQLCMFIKDRLEKNFDEDINFFTSAEFKSMLVDKWREAVVKDYDNYNRGEESTDDKKCTRYGTTLLFAFTFKGFYIVGQLGDGGIVILNKDDSKRRIHKTLHGQKIGSGTASLCMEYADAFIDIKIYPEEECNGIVLMTDGYYDLFESDEYRFKASRFFVDKLREKHSDKEIEEDFIKKYNEAVDFVSDDISIGILMPVSEPAASNGNNTGYEISGMRTSCSRTTCKVKHGDKDYKGICINDYVLKVREQLNKNNSLHDLFEPKNGDCCQEMNNVIFAKDLQIIDGLPYHLYDEQDNDKDKYVTLDDYCEEFIVNKKYSMDPIKSLRVLINILKTIMGAEELLNKSKISLAELSNMIEFSLENGHARIYWTNPKQANKANSDEANESMQKAKNACIVARFVINFLAVGQLFYNDNDKESERLRNANNNRYEANLQKYPSTLIQRLRSVVANNTCDMSSFKNILERIQKLLGFRCSNCGAIMSFNSKACCSVHEQLDTSSMYRLQNNDDPYIMPIIVNSTIFVYNAETCEYEDVIKVVQDDKFGIGFQNISTNKWSVIKDNNDNLIEVKPNVINALSDSKALIINNGVKYSIMKTQEI